MLKLADFYHLPELDDAVARLIADAPGLVVVAGLDPRPASGDALLPSGRPTIFRILLSELLDSRPRSNVAVVAPDRESVRLPRGLGRRASFALVQPPLDYPAQIAAAAARRPDLLVVDRLCEETLAPALEAARSGVRVLTQLDTVFCGAGVVGQLRDMGAAPELLAALAWVVAVQRLPALCPSCRHPEGELGFFAAAGCPSCGFSGRSGDIALFDVFCARAGAAHSLPLDSYASGLARQGYLSRQDVERLADDQLRRTYRLLAASEAALTASNAALERKIVELESANRVLKQRTAALMSLQEIGVALTGAAGLGELLARVCRHARDLCGADRAIVYLREDDHAEVLAVGGWGQSLVGARLAADAVFGQAPPGAPRPHRGYPPGVPERHADVEGGRLRAGLEVALLAQDEPVGLMVVHTTLKPRFAPGEVALLATLANQAALSIQRARLVEQLRQKIAMLEQAQAALVAKERLEREMELAHDVQQSVLPRVFPEAPGAVFAARNAPARQVGGDLYDVIRLGEHRFGLVIADVSGKGMPAALYMALVRSLLLAESRRAESPRAVLLSVNRLLRELGEPHMFVTVFFGVLDTATLSLRYCRAGHDYPIILRGGAAHTLDAEGTVLGFFGEDELRLDEDAAQLAPGDRLVLYTDGLTDAQDERGRRYGLERLEDWLRGHAALGAAALIDATFDELLGYQGGAPQYDDMTMLVAEVGAL